MTYPIRYARTMLVTVVCAVIAVATSTIAVADTATATAPDGTLSVHSPDHRDTYDRLVDHQPPLLAPGLTVGGQPADPASPVHQATMLLHIDGTKSERICTGTLINPRTILSARHCVYDDDNRQPDFDGALALFSSSTGEFTQMLNALQSLPEEDFSRQWGGFIADTIRFVDRVDYPTHNGDVFGDIALLHVEQGWEAPASISPVPVWAGDITFGGIYVASGFGTGGATPLPHLGQALYAINGQERYTVDRGPEDIGYRGVPVNQAAITLGDSGGPLHNYQHVIGVNSVFQRAAGGSAWFAPLREFSRWVEQRAPGSTTGAGEVADPVATISLDVTETTPAGSSEGPTSVAVLLAVLAVLAALAAAMGVAAVPWIPLHVSGIGM